MGRRDQEHTDTQLVFHSTPCSFSLQLSRLTTVMGPETVGVEHRCPLPTGPEQELLLKAPTPGTVTHSSIPLPAKPITNVQAKEALSLYLHTLVPVHG